MPIVVSLGKEYIIDNFHMNPLRCIIIISPLFLCYETECGSQLVTSRNSLESTLLHKYLQRP